jgi:hypothetical protein
MLSNGFINQLSPSDVARMLWGVERVNHSSFFLVYIPIAVLSCTPPTLGARVLSIGVNLRLKCHLTTALLPISDPPRIPLKKGDETASQFPP